MILELKGIYKDYQQGKMSVPVLKDINFSMEEGEYVAIMGPSGSGKTTLLRTINFLDAADEGSISVSGFEVDAKKHSKSQVIELRRKTAMVFQNYNLFANKTILENVMEGLVTVKKFKKSDAEAMSREILKKVGLEERCDFYPAQLSGGQQQRAGIARALILDPDVILFDEPTSALDPELVGEVLNTIKAVAQTGITMIVVTHEIAFAREVASRVVFMEGGVVVEEGKPEEILVAPKHPSTQRFLKRITNPNAE